MAARSEWIHLMSRRITNRRIERVTELQVQKNAKEGDEILRALQRRNTMLYPYLRARFRDIDKPKRSLSISNTIQHDKIEDKPSKLRLTKVRGFVSNIDRIKQLRKQRDESTNPVNAMNSWLKVRELLFGADKEQYHKMKELPPRLELLWRQMDLIQSQSAVEPERSSLQTLNLFAGIWHFIQCTAHIMWTVSSSTDNDPLVLYMHLISAVFHLFLCSPGSEQMYWNQVVRRVGHFKWIEHTISSSLMMLSILKVLDLDSGVMVRSMLLRNLVANGLFAMQERHDVIRRKESTHSLSFWFGIGLGLTVWTEIGAMVEWEVMSIEEVAILIGIAISFNLPIVMVTRLIGERQHLILSLVSKTVFGWLVVIESSYAMQRESSRWDIASMYDVGSVVLPLFINICLQALLYLS